MNKNQPGAIRTFRLPHMLFLCFCCLLLQQCKKTDRLPAGETAAADGTAAASLQAKKIQEVDLQLMASSLVSPIGMVAFPDLTGRMAVIDQIGKIWIMNANGTILPQPFMDITSRIVSLNPIYDERGLLGLAFHPNYRNNGRFFVYYTAPPRPGAPPGGTAWNNFSRIVEYRVSANPNLADPGFERAILEMDDPQSNHNGGTIAFGPDGYLYIAIGDGGGANDVAPGHVEDWYPVNAGGNGQDIEANLFGNILRLNINSGNPYSIPSDNPLVGRPGRDEIWAYGFRNPFRFSFDMGDGHDLIAGDAGQLLYEEIDLVKKGGNYGWNVKEGAHCFNAADPLHPFASCPDRDIYNNKLVDPVIEVLNFRNPEPGVHASTIIGGNVYRGDAIPMLKGKYIFGTFSQIPAAANGELFVAHMSGNSSWNYIELPLKSYPNDLGQYLKGFGQDLQGEIYLTTSSILGPSGTTGKIFKLVPAP